MHVKLFVAMVLVFVSAVAEAKNDKVLDRILTVVITNQEVEGVQKKPLTDGQFEVLKLETARIFSDAGVAVRYQIESDDSDVIRVNLISAALVICKAERINRVTVGCALRNPLTKRGTRAYVHVPSIRDVELAKGLPGSMRLLGKAVVHEIGHLLGLDHFEGGTDGIMTATPRWWEPKSFQYWNDSEVAHIREVLEPLE